MLNLLYGDELDGKFPDDAVMAKNTEDTFVHWYGKRDSKPGRKVGHITTVAETSTEALAIARNVLNSLHTQKSI
jgi:5-(carboxyamino)imidazole ribonucleotide synthase